MRGFLILFYARTWRILAGFATTWRGKPARAQFSGLVGRVLCWGSFFCATWIVAAELWIGFIYFALRSSAYHQPRAGTRRRIGFWSDLDSGGTTFFHAGRWRISPRSHVPRGHWPERGGRRLCLACCPDHVSAVLDPAFSRRETMISLMDPAGRRRRRVSCCCGWRGEESDTWIFF